MIVSRRDLSWTKVADGVWVLFLGHKPCLAIIPDCKYPEMFRVRDQSWVSDMANIDWAKSGAVSRLLNRLNRTKKPT